MPEIAALELQIGANVDKAVAGVQQFDKSIFELQEQLKDYKAAQETTFDPKQFVQYGQKINAITKQIKERFALMEQATVEAGGAIKAVGAPIEQTTRQMQTMNKRSSSATNSLFALSGVVQDAPFGFRAIANNIQFFAQEMAYTAKASGGFRGALKAMAASFSGPAGIIFAISAVTSLLPLLFGSMKKGKDAVDDLAISVKNLSDAQLTGSKDAQKDVVNLDLLYKAATNVNKPMSERLDAVKELQRLYPTYLGNQSKENILTGKAAASYENLKNQIIATARARAAENNLVKNQQQQLDIQAKINDLLRQRTDLQTKQDKLAANANAISGLNALSQTGNITAGSVVNLQHQMNALDDQIKGLVGDYGKLDVANQTLADNINATDLTKKVGAPGPQPAKPESQFALLKRAAANVNSVLQTTRASYAAFTKAASATVGDTITVQFTKIGKAVKSVEPLLTDAQIRFEQFQTRLKDGMAEAAQVIRDGMQDAIAGVTEGFASGGFAGAAQALMNTLGDIAIQLGKIAIGVGIGIQGIQLALESLNPFAAIAAGVGLVALGALAKASVKGLAFADGGVVYGPTNALIGEYAGARSNPEVVAPLNKLKDILGTSGGSKDIKISGEFRLVGNDLVAAVNNTNMRNGRVNG